MKANRHDFPSRIAGTRTGVWLAAGATLALSALIVRQKTRRVEADHPPRGRFLDVEGVRLHYLERGHGQPLVLLHGNGSMAEDFDISGLLDLAAVKYRVIAFDRPGYGYSRRPHDRTWTPAAQADLLHHALQRLGIERAAIVAHSWGTLVALQLALKYPSAVHGLVLLSGYYFPTVRLDVPWMSMPALPVVGSLLRHTLSPLIARLNWPLAARRMFSPAPVAARFADFPAWMSLRPRQMRANAEEAAMMIPSVAALVKRYRELKMPIILLAGDGDRHVNTRLQSERLHHLLPHSELRIAPGAGHMVHYLVPQQILSAVGAIARQPVDTFAAPHRPLQDSALNSAGAVGI
ncbi:MAG TPA: alpha/beta hydrolase [Paucimonas sp.]|nr:alpha/beta hydrolase [Paucimonas sp.]